MAAGLSRFTSLIRRPLALLPHRTYGAAAAQLQYDDYDYDYDYEDEVNGDWYSDRRRNTEESDGSSPGRGVQWVIMGEPFAQKHLYAQRLAKLLQVPHISMGSLVRQELHPRSSLYKQIANAVNQGKLVQEDIIFGLLSKRLEDGYSRGETGFILDGIPRTRIQAEILDQMADIDLVVNFKCEKCMINKHMCTGIYSPCQEHSTMRSPGLNLNLQSQDDKMNCTDTDGAWKEKLRGHQQQSKLVEEYYKKQKKLIDFQVAGTEPEPGETTWKGLLAALHLQHMNAAVRSSQKLTA